LISSQDFGASIGEAFPGRPGDSGPQTIGADAGWVKLKDPAACSAAVSHAVAFFCLMVNTGHSASRTTFSATEPNTSRSMPVEP
jgi:hypothetical protein